MTTITVQGIKESDKTPGKFSVKDASGAYWDAWDVAHTMKAGGTYDVEFKSREYNGKTYRTITKAVAQSNGHAQNGAAASPGPSPEMSKAVATATLAPDRGGVPPHVSNFVGQAIAAGVIKDPFDMIIWAQYAYLAGQRMTNTPADMAQQNRDDPF